MEILNFGDYHKINSLYKRDKAGRVMRGEYSQKEFEYLRNVKWVATEKIDGTNIHFDLITDDKGNVTNVGINGRTSNAEIPKHLMIELEKIKQRLLDTKIFKPNSKVQIFGEGYGPGIHSGGGYCDTPSFIVFDIVVIDDNNKKWYLNRDVIEVITKAIGLDIVPIRFGDTLSEIQQYVERGFESKISKDRNLMAEGVVCVPVVPLFDNKGHRIIVKIKTKDYEL